MSAFERLDIVVMINVLRQVCLLCEGMTTEITHEGSLARVDAEVVHKVVPLAENILLAAALRVNALEENDSSVRSRVLELILFIPYCSDLVIRDFSIFGGVSHDEH